MPTASENDYLAEQFDDLGQQSQADTMGMWVFLSTELLLFGAVFMAFAIYRGIYPTVFAEAATHLDLMLGSINTAILLTSGLTMALAEQAVGAQRRRLAMALLWATLVLGAIFLSIKGLAWSIEYHEGLMSLETLKFSYEGAHPDIAQMFFNFNYLLTGLHALHMSIGLGAICVMLWLGRNPSVGGRYVRQVRITGLYWAFVDIVWVFVFTSLFLLRA